MHRFFVDHLAPTITLSGEESRHAVRVLRLKIGDWVELTDGHGTLAKGIVTDDDQKTCTISVSDIKQIAPPQYRLHIAIAPTKMNERFEWFLEKATEIGVTDITPILTANSERSVIKHDRLHKIIISATKQSGRLHAPVLNPLVKLSDFTFRPDERVLVATCANETNKMQFNDAAANFRQLVILIGPEGDFNSKEILDLVQLGATPITLGENRLRTETAGIVACLLGITSLNG